MRLRKVFAAFAALVLAVSANAQETDFKTLVFVDANGNVLENGATITVTEIETDPQKGDMIVTGLSVKNTTTEEVGTSVEVNITQMDNGKIDCCFPITCSTCPAVGVYNTIEGPMMPSETKNFQTEWFFTGTGKCSATFKLKLLSVEYDKWGLPTYSFKADGPSVTVNFINDPTGIDGVTGDKAEKTVEGYYTIDGQRLNAPQKGINIVKYSDGESSKIVY